jgi:hypothetical protein
MIETVYMQQLVLQTDLPNQQNILKHTAWKVPALIVLLIS